MELNPSDREEGEVQLRESLQWIQEESFQINNRRLNSNIIKEIFSDIFLLYDFFDLFLSWLDIFLCARMKVSWQKREVTERIARE